MRIRTLTAAVGVLAATVITAPTIAAPPTVAASTPGLSCGDTIEGHVILVADLRCPGHAVALTLADGATLDLSGHRLVGDGTGTGVRIFGDQFGTVRNGTIRGWKSGIDLGWSETITSVRGRLTLDGLMLRDNTSGVHLMGLGTLTPHVEISDSRLVLNETGIFGLGVWGQGSEISVSSSRFIDNGTGISLTTSRTSVTDSVVAHNGTGLACNESHCAIEGSILRDNTTAVSTSWYGTADIRHSTIVRNDVGLSSYWVPSVPNVIESNVLRDNGVAVRLNSALGELNDNTFVRNEVGFEARSDDGPPDFTASLVGNKFRRNGDGILSVVGESRLEGNTAVRNARWGIHAPGAVDLGGNTARGNGNDPQCVGVVCDGPGPRS